MKKIKKILSLLLVFSILLTIFSSNALFGSAKASNANAIEEIEVDLTKLTSLNKPVSITPKQDGVVAAYFYQSWYPEAGKDSNGIIWPTDILAIKNSNNDFVTIEDGYKYSINVKYTVTSVEMAPQISIVHNNDDSTSGYNVGAVSLKASEKHSATGTFVLSTVVDGVANRPLRLAFGGSGKIVIEEIKIQRVARTDTVKTVTYVDGGFETVEFATDSLKTPEFKGAKETVFGNWYANADFSGSAVTTPEDGGKYYAKWLSVTRELDLKNLNRMNGWNDGGSDDSSLKLIPETDTSAMKVVVNKTTTPSSFWAGSDVNLGGSQDISLEYFDYDDEIQDKAYSGYVLFEKNKSYAINVDYSVIESTSNISIYLTSNTSNISYGDDKKSKYIGKVSSLSAGKSGVMYAEYSAGNLISAGYGSTAVNDKLRLSFYGAGTVIINSITIQEIYTADQTDTAVPIYIKKGAKQYKFAAIKKDGNWIMPQPSVDGKVVDEIFDGWYTNSALTTKLSGKPAVNAVLYPKYLNLVRELDLSTSNRMAGFNDGGDDDTNLKLTPATDESPLKVEINANSYIVGNYWPDSTSPNYFPEYKQHISLEYFDNDPSKQDMIYDNYVKVESGKKYSYRIKYNATAISNKVQMLLVSNTSNLSYNAKTPIMGSKEIYNVGSGELSGVFSVGHGGAGADNKVRLGFAGTGTIEIESITIQEVNEADVTAGKAVDIKISDNGKTYRYYAVNNGTNWVMPNAEQPKGNVIDSGSVVWYSDAGLTTPMITPVTSSTYYPKWSSITREIDIKNANRMVFWDGAQNVVYGDGTGLTFVPATDTTPMIVTVDSTNIDSATQHISLEYYDEDGAAANVQDANTNGYVSVADGKLYGITVNYKVTNVGETAPTIAILNSSKAISYATNQKQLASATINENGEYVLSHIVSAGADGCVAGDKLRLAFVGKGTFEISSITIKEVYPQNDVKPVVFKDGLNSYNAFLTNGDSFRTISEKAGYVVDGWATSNGKIVTQASELSETAKANVLTAKWLIEPTVYDIDLTKSQILKSKDDNGNTVLEIAPDENNNDLDVKVNSGWKNVLVDENGNYKTGVLWPDALLALKFGDGLDPSDFVKLQKDYKYVVNIEYEVISASDTDILQIAIVKNNSTISANDNGSVILNANTHSTPGEYSISAAMSNIDNVPLRLAFGGIADVKITSVKLTLEHKKNDTILPVTYVDGESNYSKFQALNSALDVPVSQGFVFDGWFNSSGDKVVDINGVTEPVTVTAKWTGVKTVEIDLTKSAALRKEDSTGKTVMNLEVDGNDDLNIKLDSGWNNIFKDKNGELRTNELAPDAIIALKNGIGTTPKNYFKVGKYYKYLINVDYEVKVADPSFNPQIAIVRNKSTNSAQLNGTYVLNANTHSEAGEYQLSAIVSNLNNIPIRLAFGGLGEIVVKKVTVSLIMEYEDKYVSVTYYDGESNFSVYQNHNSDLYTPAPNDFEFVGWYNKAGEKVENTNGVTDSISVYAKWTGIQSFDVKPAISQALKYENASKEVVMELTPNSDDTLEITLKSGWNNIFRDKSGNLRTKTRGSDGKYADTLLYPDAILALKTGIDDEPTSYLKLKKNYNYVINIDYSVTSVHSDFAPQIAIIKNATTNSAQLNGSIVLNSNTHINKGDYSISAYAENINGVPIRLAFGGIGKIVIKKITVSYIRAVDDSYNPVTYVDGDANNAVFLKKGENLSNPADTTGFKGWYKNSECIGKPITSVDGPATVYAKRNLPAYTFNINFDTQIQKDYYAQGNNTLTNFVDMGSKAEVVTSVGNNGTDAVRLTYKRIDSDNTDYVANPYLNLYDTNITTGEVNDKRFVGKDNTQYMVTFKYKVEETDGKSLELYLGKRNFGQSANSAINDLGQGLWQIKDATKIGATITEKTNGWIEAKAYYTAASGWFPVILLKTNNQSKSVDPTTALASILIDDISLTEITPITEDTVLGTMDYENYTAKTYDSASADSIIGNKYGVKVTNSVNHTNNGKNALELTLMSDSLQYSGNTVISINNEPLRSERNAAYLVEFYVMSPNKIDDLIWGVNSVAGDYSSITSKHNIEIRDKINLKANKWEKITAYIPKFKGFEDAIAMFSIAMAANGYDGTNVYIDDISVKLLIESEVVNFVDSDKENPVRSIAQRGFKGQPFNSFPYLEKDGFLFDGWYDTADCDGKEYKVSDIFPEDKDEITLYAKWISTDDVVAKDFTAGSFDVDIYDKDVVPYENICETSEESIYGITNVDSTQSGAWVKDAGIYGNGTADYDGALSLSNDTYSKYLDTDGRNAIALINEDGTRFAVKKGEKYSIKFDYINGSNVGTSYIQTVISTGNGYRGFGDGKDQGLRNIAVHGTDSDYQTYQEYFVADYTGFVYITFAARTDDNSPHNLLYHRVYIDNVKITTDSDVKKLTFIADGKTYRTYYGKAGDIFPVFDAIEGDTRTTEFDGFYTDAKFENRIENYVFTNEDVQTVYIKYKKVDYTTPSNFSSPITLDFEDTKWLGDYYRQGKHMTYWSRGEANPEWQFIYSNKENAYGGSNYIKLNGYTTYWNIAKFTLYDKSNPSGTMLLEKGMTYRVKLMTRCEDKYDSPNLTVTLENPNTRYLLENNTAYAMVAEEKEYANDYMCYTVDITVPDDIRYLPALAIRKNQNDLQTLFIDEVSVEKLINCQVTFEENGGTEVDDITVQIHETIPDPGMPFREGYDFKGWFMDAELTKAWDFDTMTVESDVTLYAKWEKATNELETDVSLDEDTDSNPPTMLEGDNHNYPVAAGLSTWIIVLIVAGSVIALLGVAALVWLLIVRKKRKN